MKIKEIIILFLLFFCFSAVAQNTSRDFVSSFSDYYSQPKKASYKGYFKERKKLTSKILFPLLYIYKEFFSSQDGSHCTFTPSCSDYAVLTMQKNGLILGYFDTFDRITRCNVYNYGEYPMHKHSRLKIDFP